MLLKSCTQYVSKTEKLNNGHRTGKGQFSFQSQKKVMSKIAQTTTQSSSFYTLVRLCSKCFKLGLRNMWTKNFQMYKLCFEEAEKPEIKLSTFVASWRKQGNFGKKTKIYFCFIDYSKAFDSVYHQKPKTGKFLKQWEYQTTLLVSWEICMWVKKQ